MGRIKSIGRGIRPAIAFVAAVSLASLATAEEGAPGVRVGGEVTTPALLTAADLAGMPRVTVKAVDHGVTAEFEGVRLWDILCRAGLSSRDSKRGNSAAEYVVADAADGYRAVYALLELDPEVTDKVVILADRRDGRPMGEGQGPYRIIAPGEKRQARWIRMVEAITVRAAEAGERSR